MSKRFPRELMCALCCLSLVATAAGCGGALPMAAVEPAPRGAPYPTQVAETKSVSGWAVGAPAPHRAVEEPNTESYARIYENGFLDVTANPLSTFGVDVDTASYTNVRRFLDGKSLPPADAVRIEEFVNYFTYDFPPPSGDVPFSVSTEISPCPWSSGHKLARIGIQGRRLDPASLPPRNLVFLIDVSGSMDQPNKLPLVQSAVRMLVDQLGSKDRIAIVVYAGTEGLALQPTSGDHKGEIRSALGQLQAGGSTNGGAGIRLAYRVARDNFQPGGINRVILATDGDFNVGVTSQGELVRLVEQERQSGVFLTVLGVGTGNLKDSTMEMLADKGNGNYAYLDSLAEARKVLVTQAGSTLVTIAKDAKVQVEFNPRFVQSYRLIGYENRLLQAQDFRDDQKDAGDIGAGHSVTALYEIVPPGVVASATSTQPLRVQSLRRSTSAAASDEIMTVKVRYKEPSAETSKEIGFAVADRNLALEASSRDQRFAASVAAFGMLLRGSEHKGTTTYALVRGLAESGMANDPEGYRRDFVRLVKLAERLTPSGSSAAIAR